MGWQISMTSAKAIAGTIARRIGRRKAGESRGRRAIDEDQIENIERVTQAGPLKAKVGALILAPEDCSYNQETAASGKRRLTFERRFLSSMHFSILEVVVSVDAGLPVRFNTPKPDVKGIARRQDFGGETVCLYVGMQDAY
jgi:hypothetical protein